MGADAAVVDGREEGDCHQRDNDTDPGPGHDGLFGAVLTGVSGPEYGKYDGGCHGDQVEDGGHAHVSDQDTGEHDGDNALGSRNLGDLVGGLGRNIALQGLIVDQDLDHVFDLQLFRRGSASVVLGPVILGNANGDQNHADEAQQHEKFCQSRHKFQIDLSAEPGQHDVVGYDGQYHGDQVVEGRDPDTDGGALSGIIGHDGGQGLGRHVLGRVAQDIDYVKDAVGGKACGAGKTHPSYAVIHKQQGRSFQDKAADQQDTELAESGIHLVVDQGQQRVGDRVQDP